MTAFHSANVAGSALSSQTTPAELRQGRTVLAKDLDIGALVRLLYRDWDLDPLPPKNRARYREAAAALERQILARAQRSEVPCIRDQFELARVYLRLGQDCKAGACYRAFLGLSGK